VNPDALQSLSRALTDDVAAEPSVRTVLPPGPALAVLVRDVRSALDVPRGGGAVLVREAPSGLEVRVVVEVAEDVPTADVVRRVRDAVRARVLADVGVAPAGVTVRVVDIG
jgi:uncharacterized alkaline shock family protein YloU